MEHDTTPGATARHERDAHLERNAVSREPLAVTGAALGAPARGFAEDADRRAPLRERRERVVVVAFVLARDDHAGCVGLGVLRQEAAINQLLGIGGGQQQRLWVKPVPARGVERDRASQAQAELPVVLITRERA